MNNTLIYGLYEQQSMAKNIAQYLQVPIASMNIRQFPDGETYLKIDENVRNKNIILVCSLNLPNEKILPLLFAAQTLKSRGANRVGLCAPYLAYMRQDKQFTPGESITSQHFAELISHYFDFLLTVDPHLHRYHDLSQIYTIPTRVLHASDDIAQWVNQHIDNPILIGPDSESEQWVKDIALRAGNKPYTILEKVRHGDNEVEVSIPELRKDQQYTPVLIDDIVSTAHTMQETIKHLKELKMPLPVCIAVHAIFAQDAYQRLTDCGAKNVISCNTIEHPSNQIDLSSLLADGITEVLSDA